MVGKLGLRILTIFFLSLTVGIAHSTTDISRLVAITPDGKKTYIIDPMNNHVDVFNSETGIFAIIKTNIGFQPFCIVMTSDGTKAYVSNQGDHTISIIDTVTDTVSLITANIRNRPFFSCSDSQ